MNAFLRVWAGQLLSLTGSAVTSFALGIWIYQQTRSASLFSTLAIFTVAPAIIMAPFAGVVTDRWNRRTIMMLADSASGMISLVLAVLVYSGALRFWHICIITLFTSTVIAFHRTAYSASVALLVKKKDLARANGLMQIANAGSQLLSPMLAAVLVATVKLTGIILIDMATFLVAVATILTVDVPSLPRDQASARRKNIRHDLLDAWDYLKTAPGLLCLNGFTASINTLLSSAGVLLAPLVLSFGSPAVLGGVMTCAGLGTLTGGLVLAAWGGPKSPITGVVGFSLLTALSVALTGLRPSAVLVTAGVFGALASLGGMNGSAQAVMQTLVPTDLQGRVFSGVSLLTRIAAPISYVFAGPVADKVFQPLLSRPGFWADTIGAVVGTGPGRGVGLYFVAISIVCAGIALAVGPRIHRRLGANSSSDAAIGVGAGCAERELPLRGE